MPVRLVPWWISRLDDILWVQVAKIRVWNIFAIFITHEMETDFIMEDRTILGSESKVLLRNCKGTRIRVTKGIEEKMSFASMLFPNFK
jgi:hypothetical protein